MKIMLYFIYYVCFFSACFAESVPYQYVSNLHISKDEIGFAIHEGGDIGAKKYFSHFYIKNKNKEILTELSSAQFINKFKLKSILNPKDNTKEFISNWAESYDEADDSKNLSVVEDNCHISKSGEDDEMKICKDLFLIFYKTKFKIKKSKWCNNECSSKKPKKIDNYAFVAFAQDGCDECGIQGGGLQIYDLNSKKLIMDIYEDVFTGLLFFNVRKDPFSGHFFLTTNAGIRELDLKEKKIIGSHYFGRDFNPKTGEIEMHVSKNPIHNSIAELGYMLGFAKNKRYYDKIQKLNTAEVNLLSQNIEEGYSLISSFIAEAISSPDVDAREAGIITGFHVKSKDISHAVYRRILLVPDSEFHFSESATHFVDFLFYYFRDMKKAGLYSPEEIQKVTEKMKKCKLGSRCFSAN